MDWWETVRIATAVAVPLCAVAALFYGMMLHTLKPIREDLKDIREDLKELRRDVHSIDVRLAKVEQSIEHMRPAPG